MGGGFLWCGGAAWTNYGMIDGELGMQVAMHAAIGGTASVIGGGKFANGALTAAFGYLFSAIAEGARRSDQVLSTDASPSYDPRYCDCDPNQGSQYDLRGFREVGPQDKWYGYNDKAFRDWVHQIKQDWGTGGAYQFTKPELDSLHQTWVEEGKPRGKGGTSGRGGSTRGGGGGGGSRGGDR